MKLSTLVLTALLAAAASLHADTVTLILDPTTVELNPGQTFTFDGVVVNTGLSPVDLNDIDVTLDGSLFQVDSSPFFSGPATVAPASGTSLFPLFTVTVDLPYNAPLGIQMGTVTILGGVEVDNVYDPTTQDVLGSAPFTVNVVSTPEPSTFAMMTPAILVGIGLLSHKRRRRRR
jgi:hypothetical protein